MILLNGSRLTLDELLAIADDYHVAGLSPDAVARVDASRAVVDRQALGGAPVYGINTGFGALAETAIPLDALGALQVNLLRSHAAGVGDALPVRIVRAAMALRANVLAKGFSGIRRSTLERLLDMLNHRVHPRVPSRGSVGASGDLAPLAHLSLVLIGEGHATVADDATIRSGRDALAVAGLLPVTLGPKEGLALINGTQPSTAVAALAVAGADRLARAADVAAALSIDALRGSVHPFDPRIHDARPYARTNHVSRQHPGVARRQRHQQVSRALRPRAGCLFDAVRRTGPWRCARGHHVRADAAHDRSQRRHGQPDGLRESEDQDEIVSGGNFHGAPVAIAADVAAIALAQLATISERRSDRLVNPALSGLPAFLTAQSGLQSGYMMAQVTAAALTSEMKTLAHPASVDTIPTSANREDHVSMSMGAALKAAQALDLARRVVAVEILCACQAIDLLAPLTTSPLLARVHAHVREIVPVLTFDRPPAPDIDAIAAGIANGSLLNPIAAEVK